MSYNGAGVFNLVSGNPVVTGTTISSTWANNTLSDIANGLSLCITKDGQQTPTNNIPLGNFRITNMADGTSLQDAVTLKQLQNGGSATLAAVTGTDTITATTTPGIANYVAGQRFQFVAAGANTTGTVTLNINGLGAKAVTQLGAYTLQPGAIQTGALVTVIYDGTQFQALGINKGDGIVGLARNAKMYVSAASNTGTFTASEIVVETALGGVYFRLPSFSQSINLATTGAGGMDTGLAPSSGYVALYVIYNSTTGASSMIAQTVSGLMPEIYGGANMPSGYTASALVGLWPTTASRQFGAGSLKDRKFFFASQATAVTSSTAQGAIQTVNISSIVPANANELVGQLTGFVGTAGSLFILTVYGSSAGTSFANFSAAPAAAAAAESSQFRIALATAQTLYYTSAISGGTFTYTINITGFDF